MKNMEVREKMRLKRIFNYEVAEAMGMSESAFSRKLRKELPQEEKMKILEVIQRLVNQEKLEVV